jgi:hypothetical protein
LYLASAHPVFCVKSEGDHEPPGHKGAGQCTWDGMGWEYSAGVAVSIGCRGAELHGERFFAHFKKVFSSCVQTQKVFFLNFHGSRFKLGTVTNYLGTHFVPSHRRGKGVFLCSKVIFTGDHKLVKNPKYPVLQQARDGRSSTGAAFCAAATAVVLAFACVLCRKRCWYNARTFIGISRQPTICQGAGQGAVDSHANAAAGSSRGSATDCAARGNPKRAWSAASLHPRAPGARVQPASPATCSSFWRRALSAARRALQQSGRGTARDSLQRAECDLVAPRRRALQAPQAV